MKSLSFAFAAVSLALAAPALAQGPAMKAEHAMKMESHDKMAAGMSGEKKDAMKPMAMQAEKPKDAMKSDMAMKPDRKH